jgi:hypothetical protein
LAGSTTTYHTTCDAVVDLINIIYFDSVMVVAHFREREMIVKICVGERGIEVETNSQVVNVSVREVVQIGSKKTSFVVLYRDVKTATDPEGSHSVQKQEITISQEMKIS